MPKLKQWLGAVTVLLSLLMAQNAMAWGNEGHRVVCDLAFGEMHITTKKEVKRLLKELPSEHKQRINHHLKRSKRADITFADACVWADTVRDLPEYQGFAAWHNAYVERDAQGVNSSGCLHGCVLEAIPLHHRVLKESQNSWQKLQALMLLGHWVGDIHQPLHLGFADDRGGKILRVRIDDKETNYHNLWDKDIIRWMVKLNGWDDEALGLNVSQVNIMGYDTAYSMRAAPIWAEESRQIAQSPTTGYCQMHKGECRKPKGRPPYQLAGTYYSQQWSVVRVRLRLAAERLANAVDEAMN